MRPTPGSSVHGKPLRPGARLSDRLGRAGWIVARSVLIIVAIVVVGFGVQMIRHSGNSDLPARAAEDLRLATYNVHYIVVRRATGPWSVADWNRRKGPMDQAFKAMQADVVTFQEMESFAGGSVSQDNLTLDWLLAQNPDYGAAAVGDPRAFPSTQPILYRKARLEMLDQGWFFFSETPDVLYARTFNGSYPAFASWAVFRDRLQGHTFRVINIHTDFSSRSNRIRSIDLVAERLAPWRDAGEKIFVTGDLNARFGDRPVRILQEARVIFAPVRGATYHFNRGWNLFGAIDHVGHLGAMTRVSEPVVMRRKFDGEWPTDHYPVVVDYRFEPN